ncbi:MAG: carbohydrate ABC transporter permease [Clostridia bacterium]|nr:carbohydrate ABC transporter permease [Clostridia bacterium]
MKNKSTYIPEKMFFKGKMSKVATYIILSFWALTTIAPLLWVLLNSFKNNDEIISNALGLPQMYLKTGNLFTNFESLGRFSDNNIFRGFMNSFIISGSALFGILLLSSMAAFVLARFKFRFTKQVTAYLVASMLIPQFAVIVPNFVIMREIAKVIPNFQGSYMTVIIPHVAAFCNFAILMLTSFMKTIPAELEEAAIIDGCSIPGIFVKIITPLSIPAFVSVGIMVFLWSYNDLITPLVYLTKVNLPVTVLISQVQGLYSTDYGAMMAAVTITVVPVLLLYVFSQEYVIKGLTAGAVKG